MDRTDYVSTLRDLLSRDPVRVRSANRRAYGALVGAADSADDRAAQQTQVDRDADLALAAAAND